MSPKHSTVMSVCNFPDQGLGDVSDFVTLASMSLVPILFQVSYRNPEICVEDEIWWSCISHCH